MTKPLKPKGPPRNRQMTHKQRAFVVHYLSADVNLNATEAAARAGYKGNRHQLQVIGSANLLKVVVAEAIEEGLAEALKGAEVTVENTLKRIHTIGLAAELAGQFAVAMRGEELKGRYLKMWTDKIEHVVDVEDITDAELVRLIEELAEEGGVNLGELLAQYGSGNSDLFVHPAPKSTN